MDPNLTLQVNIVSPRQVIFSGPALAVSSKNSSGKFDILPEHANFITLVEKQPIIIKQPDKKEVSFNFDLAILYTSKNSVKIYTDIQISLEELNASENGSNH